jgi:hypothetical protein
MPEEKKEDELPPPGDKDYVAGQPVDEAEREKTETEAAARRKAGEEAEAAEKAKAEKAAAGAPQPHKAEPRAPAHQNTSHKK